MFGKRNVQQAFTSRYLSSEVGWTREGGGGVVRACAARLCHGRSGKRQTRTCPNAYPCSDASEVPLSLRAARLCWMFRVKFRNTTVPPTLLSLPPQPPSHLIFFGCQDKTALYAAVRQEYSAEIQSLISASG